MPKMSRDSIVDQLLIHERIRPSAPAYYEKLGSAWVPTSWEQYTCQIRQVARAMIRHGIEPGNVVCMLGFNRPEWVESQLAAMMISAGLADPRMKIEIEVTALKRPGS